MLLNQLNTWHNHHHSSYGKNVIKISYKDDKEIYIKLTTSQMRIFDPWSPQGA